MTTVSSLRRSKMFVQFAIQQNSGLAGSLTGAGLMPIAAANFFVIAI